MLTFNDQRLKAWFLVLINYYNGLITAVKLQHPKRVIITIKN